jgi:uncharacterized membrane protein
MKKNLNFISDISRKEFKADVRFLLKHLEMQYYHYMINLKSELEIRMLHEKLDHLIMHQQEELI